MPAVDTHDPESGLIRDVFGSEATYPNHQHYSRGWAHWLRFFREIGMSAMPLPQQLLDHIDVKTMVGDAARIRRQLSNLAASGFREIIYTPSGPDLARELRAFASGDPVVTTGTARIEMGKMLAGFVRRS